MIFSRCIPQHALEKVHRCYCVDIELSKRRLCWKSWNERVTIHVMCFFTPLDLYVAAGSNEAVHVDICWILAGDLSTEFPQWRAVINGIEISLEHSYLFEAKPKNECPKTSETNAFQKESPLQGSVSCSSQSFVGVHIGKEDLQFRILYNRGPVMKVEKPQISRNGHQHLYRSMKIWKNRVSTKSFHPQIVCDLEPFLHRPRHLKNLWAAASWISPWPFRLQGGTGVTFFLCWQCRLTQNDIFKKKPNRFRCKAKNRKKSVEL